MKYIFLFSFSTFFFCLFAQNHEVDINYHVAINSNRNSKIKSLNGLNDTDYRDAISQSDQGVTFNYAYKIWGKVGLYATAGAGLWNSKHYLKVTEGNSYWLGNIDMEMNRFNYQFGLRQELRLYKGKVLIQLGISFLDRFYFHKHKNYNKGLTESHRDYKAYSYNLDTYHIKYAKSTDLFADNRGVLFFVDYSLNVKFNLWDNLYLSFGANYSRNNLFFYDFNYQVYTKYQGTNIWVPNYGNHGIEEGRKFAVRDHYLYLNFGVSYKFNWKKKDKK